MLCRCQRAKTSLKTDVLEVSECQNLVKIDMLEVSECHNLVKINVLELSEFQNLVKIDVWGQTFSVVNHGEPKVNPRLTVG